MVGQLITAHTQTIIDTCKSNQEYVYLCHSVDVGHTDHGHTISSNTLYYIIYYWLYIYNGCEVYCGIHSAYVIYCYISYTVFITPSKLLHSSPDYSAASTWMPWRCRPNSCASSRASSSISSWSAEDCEVPLEPSLNMTKYTLAIQHCYGKIYPVLR